MTYDQTPLTLIDAFADRDLTKVYIKDESKNPFQTIKDRRNAHVVNEASRLGVDKLALITSGNNGYSLAKYADKKGINVTCIVSQTIDPKIKAKLEHHCSQVIQENLQDKILHPEEIMALARENEEEVIWDVTNSYEDAYTSVCKEIINKLGHVDYIVVPLGSGGVFVGFAQFIESRGLPTKIIGIGTEKTFDSFADKLCTPWTPYQRAIEKYTELGHEVFRLSEQNIQKTYEQYKHLCNCEPSAAIVFAAPDVHEFSQDETIVFVNTGNSDQALLE